MNLPRLITCLCFLFFFVGSLAAEEPRLTQKRMAGWEAQMELFQRALYRHDYKKMADAMAVIEQTPEVHPKVQAALKATLEQREFNDYMKLDHYIRTNASLVIEQAGERDIQKLLIHQGRLIMACIQCHDTFLAKAVNAVRQAKH